MGVVQSPSVQLRSSPAPRNMESFEMKLPVEKWQQILTEVSHGDLCNVMLTSKHMN